MELRTWIFDRDDVFIDSFLQGSSLAHHGQLRTKEWFHWKFEQSPYGKAILACAFDENTVAGCVAYGKGLVKYHGREWKAALSYETFVRPEYQGKGLFKKLISLAESQLVKEGVQFLYNFPNSNSITGFKHMKWNCNNNIRRFYIKPLNICHCIFHTKDLRNPFQPFPSNLSFLDWVQMDKLFIENSGYEVITPIWTKEYLKWRFFSFPNRYYHVIDDDKLFSISMIGKRGKLLTARHLYSISKQGKPMSDIMGLIIHRIQEETHADLFEFSSTIYDDSIKKVHGFFKVTAHGNFCYKILDPVMDVSNFKMVFPSINAHTY